MSVKPVDFQIIIPKMSEVSKVSNDIHQKGEIFQQHGNVELKEEIDKDLKQVHDRENIRHGRIVEREKENLPGRDGRKQKKNEEKNKVNKKTIDVKI